MAKKKFKALTLISGIITILFAVALLIAIGLLVISVLQSSTSAASSEDAAVRFSFAVTSWILIPLVIAACVIMLGVCIAEFVVGSFLCGSATKSDEAFLGRSGFLITTIVFDFILAAILLSVGISVGGAQVLGVCIGLTCLCLLSASLKITDLVLAKKRYAIEKEQAKANPTTINYSSVNFDALKNKEEGENK